MVVMDADLPTISGWTATGTNKAALPELCVVTLSAHALPAHRRMAESVGVDPYLAKPLAERRPARGARIHSVS